VLREARQRGLVARVKGDSFLMAPPLVVTADQVDRMVEILRDSIGQRGNDLEQAASNTKWPHPCCPPVARRSSPTACRPR
jgi:hypothetical protein